MKKLALWALGWALISVLAAAADVSDFPPINTPATTDYFPGKFVWEELFTTNPQAAVSFYSQLFGWDSQTIQRPNALYTVMSVDGRPICGITHFPEKLASATNHGRWVGFISVPDVAKAAAALSAHGGKVVLPIKELSGRGMQTVVSTQEGVIVGLLHSSSGDPAEYRAEAGEWIWSQFYDKDTEQASKLYALAIGYDAIPDIRFDKADSYVLSSGEYARASLSPLPADHPKARPAWLGYVRVDDVDASVTKATGLGAKVVAPSRTTEGTGKLAILVDPTGAAFGVVQFDNDSKTPAEKP